MLQFKKMWVGVLFLGLSLSASVLSSETHLILKYSLGGGLQMVTAPRETSVEVYDNGDVFLIKHYGVMDSMSPKRPDTRFKVLVISEEFVDDLLNEIKQLEQLPSLEINQAGHACMDAPSSYYHAYIGRASILLKQSVDCRISEMKDPSSKKLVGVLRSLVSLAQSF